MNIKKFQVSTSDFNAELTPAAPICFVRGNYSDCILDLMRELVGNGESHTDLERVNDGFYVIHADIESEGKDYGICYIRNAEGSGDNRIGVNFSDGGINFSKADTYEFLDKREDWAMLGERYATEHGCTLTLFPAEWNKYGRAAGPIRNKEMINYISSVDRNLVIAFASEKSVGTKNTVALARKMNIPVLYTEYEGS